MDPVPKEISQELGAINLKLTTIDQHLQMIDKNIERLVQLCRLINGQLPTDPEPDAGPVR